MKWTRNEGHVATGASPQGWQWGHPQQIDCTARGFRQGGLDPVGCSETCDDSVASARRRSGPTQPRDDIANRATRAEMLVHLGELSSARQALEGAARAPGTNATLSVLTHETERLARPREPLPREVLENVPPVHFFLDEKLFLRCLRFS